MGLIDLLSLLGDGPVRLHDFARASGLFEIGIEGKGKGLTIRLSTAGEQKLKALCDRRKAKAKLAKARRTEEDHR